MKFRSRRSFRKLALHVLLQLVVSLPFVAHATLESEIQAFEAEDALRPPPPGATLFVGSSTFNSWPNLAASFPEHSVLNRGFGGSQMSDVLFYFDRVVARYRPPHIVVYEGDNDLAAGKSVSQVFGDYSNFLARVELQLPGTIIGFVSVKPSPSRAHLLTQMQQLNAQVRALAEARGHRYIDTHTPMLNTSGQPRPELFLSDMLHMNSAGYTLWTSIIEPVLDDWKTPMGGTFLFDFGAAGSGVGLGPGPNDPVNHWNNVGAALTSDTGSYSNAVTVQNVASTMSLVVVSRFNGVNEAGTTVSTIYPGNATRDSLFGNTELFGALSNVFPSFKLTGLDAATTYSFSFYASRTGVGDNRETGYTVAGATTNFAALDPANNIDNTAGVTGMSPDAAGEITISLAPTANNNNANHFTYLGVLRVDAVPPQTPLAFTQEPANQRALELQPVTFSAAVSGPPPYHVQWLRNGEPIEGATQFNYTIASATLDLDGSLYSVSVSNLAFGVTSSNALLRVVNDNVAPQVVSATARNGQTIELLFNEALDVFTANSPFNYEVNGGNPGVPAAELRPDGKTVVLTLDPPLAPGAAFTVVINDVQDLSLNTIAANTRISGTVPGPEAQVFLIDFGGANTTLNGASPDDPINHWNNITTAVGATDDGVLAGLITADNQSTTVNLVMQARFNGANENGTTASPLFPVDATRDSLYGNTEIFNNLVNIFPKFKLTGLDPALGYNLTFYASRTGVGDNRTTRYTVEGAATATAELNAANNVTNTVQVLAAHPSEAGELTIGLTPAASNNNGSHFTYLGVLRVQPAAIPLALLAPSISGGQIHLQWTGGGVLESAPTVLGPWTPVDGNPSSPASLTLNPNHSFFRIKK